MTQLPDQNHINEICRRLWCDREFGRAAIMVGAGFSRNAEKISPSSPDFPLWFDLQKTLKERLYPKPAQESGADALRLASEYEVTFGRQALDDLLLGAVPDTDHIPGKLHKLLMHLPWSDVFTTNYDTLLERTRPAIHERKYDVVHTCDDLPRGMKPRIIKLHGSFPSHRPFIFTTEDYRTYPRKFAPFVNTVQQSMMENTFCLVGFSGDDPNFLNWLGWVRDNLGESVPPVYLCGVLNLSNAARQVYTQRKIIPIDLAPLFTEEKYPDRSLRHALATEWFLWSLLEAKPSDFTCWPNPPQPISLADLEVSDELPERVAVTKAQWSLGKLQPLGWNRDLTPVEIQEILQDWRKCRQHYPGWVVVSREKRNILWHYTKYWIAPILNSVDNLDPVLALLVLNELNWRLEITLTPLIEDWGQAISKFLLRFAAIPQDELAERTKDMAERTKDKNLSLNAINDCWVSLAFAVMREARQALDETRFQEWQIRLSSMISPNLVWKAKLFYEQCLWHLFRVEIEHLKQLLGQWPGINGESFWEAKRAFLYAEIGELQKAKQSAENALTNIRDGLQKTPSDYRLLSQESFAILLLERIEQNDLFQVSGKYDERWRYLASYACDSKSDLAQLRSLVSKAPPKFYAAKQVVNGFDPNHKISSYRYFLDNQIDEIRPAFELLLVSEEAGIPVRCGYVVDPSFVKAAKWIYLFSPYWAINILTRLKSRKELESWFDRVSVANLPENQLFHIGLALIQVIEQELHRSQHKKLDELIIEFFPDFLSRLCFRFDEELLDRALNIAISIIKNDGTFFTKTNTKSLFRRILPHLSQRLISKYMSAILTFGLSLNHLEETDYIELFGGSFNLISLDSIDIHMLEGNIQWKQAIRNLLIMVEHGSAQIRGEAASRLYHLYQSDLLSSDEIQQYKRALWTRRDSKTDLPTDTSFPNSVFIRLPESEDINPQNLIRDYLLETSIPPLILEVSHDSGQPGYTIGGTVFSYMATLLNVSNRLFLYDEKDSSHLLKWSTEDLNFLLDKIIDYWGEHYGLIRQWQNIDLMGDKIKEFIASYLIPLLSQVILPNLNQISDHAREYLDSMFKDIEAMGVPSLALLPPLLASSPDRIKEIESRIKIELRSDNTKYVTAAVYASYYWIVHSYQGKYQASQDNLLNPLINLVVAAKRPILGDVLNLISILADKIPQLLESFQVEQLLVGLEYLIQDTELTNLSESIYAQEDYFRIPIDDRPDYRSAAAELAYQLYRWYNRILPEVEKPEILLQWQEVCRTDVLPEVRKAWGSED
jgi:SIR2-like domain